MIIDSHTHLNDEAFKDDLNNVIKRAEDNNLGLLLVPGWDIESSIYSIELSKQYKTVYSAVGIHPENIDNLTIKDIDKIEELSKNNKVISIGEIGLDYHYTKENKDKQIEFLYKQLELAYNLNIPVSIHLRDATSDFMDIIRNFFKNHKIRENFGLMHSFSSSTEIMNELIKYGFYFSYNGVITFKNSVTQKETAKLCPIDKILIETDAPYLTPEPLRGRRNEPSNVRYILEYIAKIKEIDIKYLENKIENNFKTLFKIKEDN